MYRKVRESEIIKLLEDIENMDMIELNKLVDYLQNDTNLDLTTYKLVVETAEYLVDIYEDMRVNKDLKWVVYDSYNNGFFNVTSSNLSEILKYQLNSGKYKDTTQIYTKEKIRKDIEYLKTTRVHVPTLANMIRKWEKTSLHLYKLDESDNIEKVISGVEMRMLLDREIISYTPKANIKHMQKLREMDQDYYVLDYGYLDAEDITAYNIIKILEYQLKYGKYNDR